MDKKNLYNVNIVSESLLPSPEQVHSQVPISDLALSTVAKGREEIESILNGKDPRFFVVVGPCSIHDSACAIDYASRLKRLSDELNDVFVLVMRVYFEKPRTSIGWKGFINDPLLDDSFLIEEGLVRARKLLGEVAELGLYSGTEALDPLTPQYLHDLITWTAIGARTAESQTHREISSGLSTSVGFKNGTDGSVEVAINAIKSASHPHRFLGINMSGQSAVFHTRGNPNGHLVMRGGASGPNYDSAHIALAELALRTSGIPQNIVVDCSHGNSLKNPELQPIVLEDCVSQILSGNRSIVGFMMESNIHGGAQSIPKDLSMLKYGVSITDGCLSWEATERSLVHAAERLRELVASRAVAGRAL